MLLASSLLCCWCDLVLPSHMARERPSKKRKSHAVPAGDLYEAPAETAPEDENWRRFDVRSLLFACWLFACSDGLHMLQAAR